MKKVHNDFGMVRESGWDGFSRHLESLIAQVVENGGGETAYFIIVKSVLDKMGHRYGCNTKTVRARLHQHYTAIAARSHAGRRTTVKLAKTG